MITEIYDFNSCPLSDRNGTYGGNSGDKEGVLIDGAYWIIKYPQNTRTLVRTGSLSYTTSPLSEYIGSHIYSLLGYPVHDTRLGIRNQRIVVACKDLSINGYTLTEFRTLKNTYNKRLNQELEKSMPSSDSRHFVMLDSVDIHLHYNPELKNVPGIKEQFYDCIIIDGLINNNDRNNGNWGILRGKPHNIPCPVFDNGSCFSPKIPESRIKRKLEEPELLRQGALNTVTAFSLDGIKNASFSELLNSDRPGINEALIRTTPLILNHIDDIKNFIINIPVNDSGYDIMSTERKSVYIEEMNLRLKNLILKRYADLQK